MEPPTEIEAEPASEPLGPPRPESEALLAALRRAIDERYAQPVPTPVDWNALFEEARPRIVATADETAFAEEAARVLASARDPNVALRIGNRRISTSNDGGEPNFDESAVRASVTGLAERHACLSAGRIGDFGYALVPRWFVGLCDDVDPAFQNVLREDFRGATGIILDVRPNFGGGEDTVLRFAGHFVGARVRFARQAIRDPRGAEGWRTLDRWVVPVRPRERRPVVVLMGPVCAASNEPFLLMMRAAGATLVGLPSRGSASQPQPYDLGHGVTVELPSKRSFPPGSTSLARAPVVPDVEVTERPTATRDPVLERAVEILRARLSTP